MNDLKSVVFKLKLIFVLLVVIPLAFMGLSESSVIPPVFKIQDAGQQFNYESLCIILTLLVVPSSLKLFSKLFKSKIEGEVSISKALNKYFLFSVLRLFSLFIVALFNIMLYYSVENSNIGLLCFFICIVAYMFCIPSTSSVERDLHVEK